MWPGLPVVPTMSTGASDLIITMGAAFELRDQAEWVLISTTIGLMAATSGFVRRRSIRASNSGNCNTKALTKNRVSSSPPVFAQNLERIGLKGGP